MLQACVGLVWRDRRDKKRFDARVEIHTHTYTHWERACYLPCSSGNSPTSSDNLDQSVGSMNPHLPGAQDKISRPSQVVRDWRHEITFGVFLTHYCLSKHNAGAGGHTRTRAHESTHAHGAEESGGVCVCVCVRESVSVLGTLPSHPFAAELRHQLWWWCAVSPPPGCEKKKPRSPKTGDKISEKPKHAFCKKKKKKKKKNNQKLSRWANKGKKKKQPSNLDPLSFVSVFLSVLKPVLSQQLVSAQPLVSPLSLLSGLHTGFVMEVHILALVPVQKWLDFPLPCDLCR